ncbi:MAG: glycosyltransferase family 1 protein [bacterium]|nr:glycosyltransferase family 1 protein [bacterium]
MKIVIDVREACRVHRAGKGQWTYGFVSELLSRGLDITLLSDSPLPKEWNCNFRILRSGWRWHLEALSYIKEQSLDLYISPTSYILPALFHSIPTALVVHDMIAFRREPHDKKASIIERFTLKRALRFSSHVCTVSKSTALDLHDRYPYLPHGNPNVIYAGPMHTSPSMNVSDKRTIVCIGTICPRKNQHRLVQAYNLLPTDIRSQYILNIVGNDGWHSSATLRLIEESEGVTWSGYASQKEYGALLSSCSVLALPSLYEGFGMQILDALQRGVPILTSDCGSLAEVVGDSAVLVEPMSVESIALGLEKIITDDLLRARLQTTGPVQAARFSWKRTVDSFLDCIKS